jgi:hypothetical protein
MLPSRLDAVEHHTVHVMGMTVKLSTGNIHVQLHAEQNPSDPMKAKDG